MFRLESRTVFKQEDQNAWGKGGTRITHTDLHCLTLVTNYTNAWLSQQQTAECTA